MRTVKTLTPRSRGESLRGAEVGSRRLSRSVYIWVPGCLDSSGAYATGPIAYATLEWPVGGEAAATFRLQVAQASELTELGSISHRRLRDIGESQ